MTKWQYTTVQFITRGLGDDSGAGDLESALNGLGVDGWELASSTVYHNVEAEQDVLLLILKRPMVEAAPPTPPPVPPA